MQLPLLLAECGFGEDLKFLHSAPTVDQCLNDMQVMFDTHMFGCGILREMMETVETRETMTPKLKPRKYRHIPLLRRHRETSVEEKISRFTERNPT